MKPISSLNCVANSKIEKFKLFLFDIFWYCFIDGFKKYWHEKHQPTKNVNKLITWCLRISSHVHLAIRAIRPSLWFSLQFFLNSQIFLIFIYFNHNVLRIEIFTKRNYLNNGNKNAKESESPADLFYPLAGVWG